MTPIQGESSRRRPRLPEELGGSRNWDYRFCWLRDSTFTLLALLGAGFHKEAKEWREWLLRAIAGSPDQMQILYGVGGERRLNETEIPWLPGYARSKPVREGNAASGQVQTDVYGEVLDLLFQARKSGIAELEASWGTRNRTTETPGAYLEPARQGYLGSARRGAPVYAFEGDGVGGL